MLFLSLYTPAVKSSGPPSPEHIKKVGALVEKSMQDGSLVYAGPLGKNGPGGAKVRLGVGRGERHARAVLGFSSDGSVGFFFAACGFARSGDPADTGIPGGGRRRRM